jgi:hypothetical protein
MRRRLLLLAFVIAFPAVACGKTAFPQVDLETIAYREEDLSEYDEAPAVVRVDVEKVWKYESWVEVQVWNERQEGVLLADIILFTDKKELQKAYEEFLGGELQEGMSEYYLPEVGYQLVAKRQAWGGGIYAADWTFQRCYALVNIWATFGGYSPLTEEGVYRYAVSLDQRLNENVCPI